MVGDYDMQTWVTLTGGTKWAFRLDGLITRAGMSSLSVTRHIHCTSASIATTGGNMIAVENAEDFEFYSANSAGGIQGLGYECRNDGQVKASVVIQSSVLTVFRPRLIRMVTSTDWSLHDLILVDCKYDRLGALSLLYKIERRTNPFVVAIIALL